MCGEGDELRLRWQLERSRRPELLDAPGIDPAALAENLRDLRYTDALLGATALTWRLLRPMLRRLPREQPLTLLDIATGGGDGPARLANLARGEGYSLTPIGTDRLREALQFAARHRALALLRHEAPELPLRDRSIDFVTLQLALHHFDEDAAALLLREMARVARHGVIVVDLQRSWVAYLGARLMARGPWGAMARHDGPLSALRAYTPAEARTLAADVDGAAVRVAGPLLLALHWERVSG
jgi:SAM-dependent methyltransferase